jgi:hypothetical protein
MKKLGINFLSFCCLFLNGWNISLAQQSGLMPPACADALYIRGNILTGEGLLSAEPQRVSALAIRDGRVTAIGSDQEIWKLRGPKTEVTDLHGAFVLPGFNDAHVHLASGGFEKLNVDLVGVKSLGEMKERTAVLGAILLTGYLGGAVASNVRAGTPFFNMVFAMLFGVTVWASLVLRNKHLESILLKAE